MKIKRTIYSMATVCIIILLMEATGELMMRYLDNSAQAGIPSYKSIRKMLINAAAPDDYPMFMPQPNLNYVNYPEYTDSGMLINNRHGYRGYEYSVMPPPEH